MIGRTEDYQDLAARAFRSFQAAGNVPGAAKCGFYLVMHYSEHRNAAQSGGWLGRTRTLLEESGLDCAEQGYLMVPMALRSLYSGDAAGALASFTQIGKIARRFNDVDLLTLSRVGRGNSLLALGETAEAVACLDEAMVAVTAGELSPILCGFMYCAGIQFCHSILKCGELRSGPRA